MKNYFASFIPAVKAILGIEAWSKDADKKDALLEEQKQKLKALNFNDTFINGFCEALKDGFPHRIDLILHQGNQRRNNNGRTFH